MSRRLHEQRDRKGESHRVVGRLTMGILERFYGLDRLIVHVFGVWEQFPFYNAARSGNWYDFGFLLGAGSPLLGAIGRRTRGG